jgi:hypothetical protein
MMALIESEIRGGSEYHIEELPRELTLDEEECVHTLLRLGWKVARLPNGRIRVAPPGRELDLSRGTGSPPEKLPGLVMIAQRRSVR